MYTKKEIIINRAEQQESQKRLVCVIFVNPYTIVAKPDRAISEEFGLEEKHIKYAARVINSNRLQSLASPLFKRRQKVDTYCVRVCNYTGVIG